MKLCIITCYKQPDYIRARTLRAAAREIDGLEVIIVKNTSHGVVRYLQVLYRTLIVRLREKPDAYLLTFRGYEMLLPVRLLSLGKPLMYDEFINPLEWAIHEHKKLSEHHPLTRLFTIFYRLLLRSVDLILTDTESHADLSSEIMNVSRKKFLSIPVGTDEATFIVDKTEEAENELFTVFYYGNMLPLHGLKYVIDTAVKLNQEPVKFVLVGGSAETAHAVTKSVGNGAKIEYKAWVEYEQLPRLMREADLCLAGPFGGTFQSNYVITGKAYQYLAMGRPTVVGLNKESDVFEDKTNALVVQQADTQALVGAIQWAMQHRMELQGIGSAGQALFKRSYTTEHLSRRLETGLVGLGLLQPASGTDKH